MAHVLSQKTQLSLQVAQKALRAAFVKLASIQPDPNQTALLLAQSALETGRWKNIYNNNFGNIKATRNWSGDRTSFPCSEVAGGVETHYPAGDAHCIFRSYPTPVLGAEDYLRTLLGNANWKRGLLSGQPKDFVKWLTAADDPTTPAYEGRYFTASPERYLTALTSIFREYGGKVVDEVPRVSPPNPLGIHPAAAASEVELPVLAFGATGPAVKLAQQLIASFWGERNVDADGAFGPITRDAVRRVEAKLGMAQTGTIGPALWASFMP